MRSSSTSRPSISRMRSRTSASAASVSASSSSPRVAARWRDRVERAAEQRAGAGRLDQGDRAVHHLLLDAAAVAEVQDRGLGEAAEHLVDGGVDEVGAGLDRGLGQQRREVEVGAPGLVHDERHAARVRDLREAADVGDGPEIGGRHRDRPGGGGRGLERGVERLGRHAVRDVKLGVDLGRDERRLQPGEHEAVDRRGVDVALHDHAAAGVAEGHARRVVSLRGAVDEKPRAPGPPRLGGEALGELERRRVRAHVDALDQGGDVERERALADRVGQRRRRARPSLVARDVKAARVALHVREQGLQVGRPVLVAGRRRALAQAAASRTARLVARCERSVRGSVSASHLTCLPPVPTNRRRPLRRWAS